MTALLDFLYSSTVWMTVILIVVIFVCVGFAFRSPFKTKTANYIYKGSLYLFAFCFMMSFNFFYYGYSDAFERMRIGDETICLMEKYERGGEGPSEHVCRLHIIDRHSGIRKERYYVGSYSELVGMRHDTICYLKDQDLVLFDARQLKEIYSIRKEDWGRISSELAVGMEYISGNQNRSGVWKPLVQMSCKNGKMYWFDPFSKHLLTAEPESIRLAEFSRQASELTIEGGPGGYKGFLRKESVDQKLQRLVPGDYGKTIFTGMDSGSYIDPFFLCIDTLKNVFIFGHYTTTDQTAFYLEAKDVAFHTIWKKSSSEFTGEDNGDAKVNVWEYSDGLLYFNCGGFVMALEPQTGKLLWKTRL